jgi:hypothetical protein
MKKINLRIASVVQYRNFESLCVVYSSAANPPVVNFLKVNPPVANSPAANPPMR